MPNLVGIGNSQVPTNAMLGGLAYQDSVGEINLEKIKARISKTAVDIFVYDTRKDSDGGAWRHRTQNKSWYNEGVSRYRGARKEFPAVAVLVLEGDDFIIYDGDDPNLPMWMVFIDGSNTYFQVTTNACVAALNGKIVSGGNASNDRLRVIDFLLDNEVEYSHSAGRRTTLNPISDRNGSTSFGAYDASLPGIVNRYVNAVAMTVLPNAPIDSATGLPIPTIAVGTNGGISLIKDDGLVFDYGSFSPVTFVAIGKDVIVGAVDTSGIDYIFKTGLAQRDENYNAQILSGTGNYYMNSNSGTTPLLRDLNISAMTFNPSDTTVYRGGDNGFDIITETDTVSNTVSNPLIAYVDTDYNSGYMVGDIKGAFLSSTNDTNVTGTELVTNGTFGNTNASSVSNWTNVSIGTGTISEGSGYATLNRVDGGNTGRIGQGMNLVAGTRYVLSFDIVSGSTSGVQLRQYKSSDQSISGVVRNFLGGTARTISLTFACESGFDGFMMIPIDGGNTFCRIDNFSVRLAEEDRSVNDNGLQVFGTITKTPVATGAELVSYGPFTDSNYLKQPYTSDLNFGSDGFSLSIWIKPAANSPYMRIVNRVQNSNDRRWELYTNNGANDITFYTRDNAQASYVTASGDAIPLNTWTHVFAVREQNGDLKLYINGVLASTTLIGSNENPAKRGLTSTTATLLVGNAVGWDNDNPFNGQLALLKISASIPSAEQIKKIYNDEKCLYHENAKCTLYGATSAVTALGFDDSTDTAYVGTASGRSDFRGLNRINNTTTAVTTAISASNGLVAEQ